MKDVGTGGTDRYILSSNGILMIRVIGVGGRYRRNRRFVCFADTKKSYCDLGVCRDAAKEVATCSQHWSEQELRRLTFSVVQALCSWARFV